MLTPACSARVRRSRRWRSHRSSRVTWLCTVAARWPGRVPGRRRWRASQPVTAFNTGADTSSLARSDTAGSRGRGNRSLARRSSPREPAPCSATLPATRHDAYPAIEWREKTSVLQVALLKASHGFLLPSQFLAMKASEVARYVTTRVDGRFDRRHDHWMSVIYPESGLQFDST